ncbi:MAG: ketol-acid reductoisomerase [Candidatus Micrarchaeota archaeon]
MKVYRDKDADESVLKGKTVAVIGYGIQGSAQALCLRDSGVDVVVGARSNGNSWMRALKDGMEVMEIDKAAREGDIVCMLTPDMTQKDIYEKSVRASMSEGKTLYFSHGFNIVFNLIKPPANVDVIMLAPKGPGAKLREAYANGWGIPALLAIHQDYTGRARETALGLAKAMGFTKPGVFESAFEQETVCDLFGEQAVLCGGSAELVKAGFDTLVDAGFPPEVAYFECLYELKLITDLIQEGGIEYMWKRVSETARYGGLTRGKRVIDERVRANMREILREIKDGRFARELTGEYAGGLKKMDAMVKAERDEQIEKVGAEIREKFEFRKK